MGYTVGIGRFCPLKIKVVRTTGGLVEHHREYV